MTNLELGTDEAIITPDTYREVRVSLDQVDEAEVLAQISIDDVVGFYSVEDLLSAIGRDAAVEYWGIIEVEEAD